MAASAGSGYKIINVGEEEAKASFESVGTPMAGWFSAKPIFDIVAKDTNEDYLAWKRNCKQAVVFKKLSNFMRFSSAFWYNLLA